MKKILLVLVFSANFLTAQNWFPLEVGNKWLYKTYSRALGTEYYDLLKYKIVEKAVVDSIIYFVGDFPTRNLSDIFHLSGSYIRYDSLHQTLYYRYKDTDRVFMDFNYSPGQFFEQYAWWYHANPRIVQVKGGNVNLFGNQHIWKGYEYSDGFDKYYAYFVEGLGHITDEFIQVILIGESDTAYYTYKDRIPKFLNLIPIDTVFTTNCYLSFPVDHWYNEIKMIGGLNYIDSVFLEGFYKKEDNLVHISPVIGYVGYPSIDKWEISCNLNLNLLTNGFKFYYRLVAKDKGIFPNYTTAPDSGYFELVYRDTTTAITENVINDFEYNLSQNYPNPFNSSTKIRFTIPTPPSSSPLVKGRNEVGSVSIKVYDVLGNEVATLVDEYKPAGSYEVEFPNIGMRHAPSATNVLPSGVYFYQLKAGPLSGSGQVFVETKKMILLR